MEKYLNASLVPRPHPAFHVFFFFFFCTASDQKTGWSLGTRQLKYYFTCNFIVWTDQDLSKATLLLWMVFHMFTNELLYRPFEDYFWYSSCGVPRSCPMAIVYNTKAVSETVAFVFTPDPPIVWWPGQWHCQEILPVCCTPVSWSSGNTGTHSWGQDKHILAHSWTISCGTDCINWEFFCTVFS